MKNKKILYIGFALALILIPFSLTFFRVLPSKMNKKVTTPTTIPTQAVITPSIGPTQAKAQQNLVERFENRTSLSAGDKLAKQHIIGLLPAGVASGTVHESSTIRIDYVKSADLLQVEILTTDIAAAKAEATSWLQAQGMSKPGMCYAPIQFYLNFDVKQELKQQNIDFNPLPEGC
jgi:hypothetical protein